MFIPKHFEITEKNEIDAFIENNSFGQLISNSKGRLFSTHIPFLLSRDKMKLIGHLAKQNSQAQDLEGQEVLVTLQGAHNYISPTWYTGSGVPTWNYQAVHIYGRSKLFSDVDALKTVVDALADKYERNRSSPWQSDYPASMLKAIVGFEISIDEIQCQYKLSQNRSEQDQEQVIEQLKSNDSIALADAMVRNKA